MMMTVVVVRKLSESCSQWVRSPVVVVVFVRKIQKSSSVEVSWWRFASGGGGGGVWVCAWARLWVVEEWVCLERREEEVDAGCFGGWLDLFCFWGEGRVWRIRCWCSDGRAWGMDAKVYRWCLGSSQGVSKRLSFSSFFFSFDLSYLQLQIPSYLAPAIWKSDECFLSLRMWFGNVDRNRKNDFDSFCVSRQCRSEHKE